MIGQPRNLPMATRLLSHPAALPSEPNSVASRSGGSHPSLGRCVQACPVLPENRQEGRTGLTRYEKCLEALKAGMFLIAPQHSGSWGCW